MAGRQDLLLGLGISLVIANGVANGALQTIWTAIKGTGKASASAPNAATAPGAAGSNKLPGAAPGSAAAIGTQKPGGDPIPADPGGIGNILGDVSGWLPSGVSNALGTIVVPFQGANGKWYHVGDDGRQPATHTGPFS